MDAKLFKENAFNFSYKNNNNINTNDNYNIFKDNSLNKPFKVSNKAKIINLIKKSDYLYENKFNEKNSEKFFIKLDDNKFNIIKSSILRDNNNYHNNFAKKNIINLYSFKHAIKKLCF